MASARAVAPARRHRGERPHRRLIEEQHDRGDVDARLRLAERASDCWISASGVTVPVIDRIAPASSAGGPVTTTVPA